jgi:hypothetical protein
MQQGSGPLTWVVMHHVHFDSRIQNSVVLFFFFFFFFFGIFFPWKQTKCASNFYFIGVKHGFHHLNVI